MLINRRAPVYFNTYCSMVSEIHLYNTRQSLMDITLYRFITMYGLLSTQGLNCGIRCLWISKAFLIWLVLV